MAAMALMLAVNFSAHAQLGGALNRVRQAAQKATQAVDAATGNNSAGQNSGNPITEAASTAASAAGVPAATPGYGENVPQLTAAERAALDKIMDESKRSAPLVPELSDRIKLGELMQGSIDRGTAGTQLGFRWTPQEAAAFKEGLIARTAENLELISVLYKVPEVHRDNLWGMLDDYDFENLNYGGKITKEPLSMTDGVFQNFSDTSDARDKLTGELKSYQTLITMATRRVPKGTVKHGADNEIEIVFDRPIQVGLCAQGPDENGNQVFWSEGPAGKPIITPVAQDMFRARCIEYDIFQTLLKRENVEPAGQRDEYWLALQALQTIVQAQRNSLAMQEKVPVPTPKMNNAALTAEMLKLAQEAYPSWGIVKLIIDEAAWRPETNALGVIIHRIINTKIILPQSGGYVMRTLSFIQPYAGGSYGATRAHGIGTDNTAVDYKP